MRGSRWGWFSGMTLLVLVALVVTAFSVSAGSGLLGLMPQGTLQVTLVSPSGTPASPSAPPTPMAVVPSKPVPPAGPAQPDSPPKAGATATATPNAAGGTPPTSIPGTRPTSVPTPGSAAPRPTYEAVPTPGASSPYKMTREVQVIENKLGVNFSSWDMSSEGLFLGKLNGQTVQENDGVSVLLEDAWEAFLDGRAPQLVSPNSIEAQPSGNGKSVLVSRYIPGRRAEIYVLDRTTGEQNKVADGEAVPARWVGTSDIAYSDGVSLRRKNPQTGLQIDTPLLPVQRPTPAKQIYQTYLYSPGGDKLAYADGLNLWLMNSDGSQRTILTRNFSSSSLFRPNMAWSADGSKLAYTAWLSTDDRRPQLWVIGGDGSLPKLLAQGFAGEFSRPSWFPDGQAVLFGSYSGGGTGEVRVAKTDGSGLLSLFQGLKPELSPDGRKVAFQRNEKELRVAFLGTP